MRPVISAVAGLLMTAALAGLWGGGVSAQVRAPAYWRNSPELSQFHVVVPDNASASVQEAAALFRLFWYTATGRTVSSSPINEGRTNVWLGAENITSDLIASEELAGMHDDTFIVRTWTPSRREAERGAQKQLLIAGGADHALFYGVYAFFQEAMDVAWLAPDLIYAPRPPRGLLEIDMKRRPEFMVREIGLLTCWDEPARNYRYAHKLYPEPLAHPGAPGYFQDMTMEDAPSAEGEHIVLLGAKKGAQRFLEEIQAAYSNENKDSTGENAAFQEKILWSLPGARVWLLAAMEHLKPVLSHEGALINAHEGSAAAAIVHTANAVAEALEEAYPGETHLVHVLLDPKAQQAPGHLRPHPKVLVQLSTASCNFAAPLSDRNCPINTAFVEVLDGWRRLNARILIYDHLTHGENPALPFPCLDALQSNILFYAQKAVEGVYYARPPANCVGEVGLIALHAFLAAQVLSDPDIIVDDIKGVFFEGYYGDAAPDMESYVDLLHRATRDAGATLMLQDDFSWLTDRVWEESVHLLEQALARDLDEPVRERVESAQTGLVEARARLRR